jgi:hypothetical protein
LFFSVRTSTSVPGRRENRSLISRGMVIWPLDVILGIEAFSLWYYFIRSVIPIKRKVKFLQRRRILEFSDWGFWNWGNRELRTERRVTSAPEAHK